MEGLGVKIDMLNMVEDSFAIYSAMTIQDRAIVDARDGLKPSARQCMYSQILSKVTYKKKFEKSNYSVGEALKNFYVHGDASCYDLMAYLAKPYNMRYALEDFKGQMGTVSTGKAAAARYTEMRLGELGCLLYEGIDQDCIDIWFDNYAGTLQYPSVTPSLGYYNICNGTMGIATSLSSSIPQFNLREVNEAMCKLLRNPDISFDEIYCPPDFCIGGTILNADEVKNYIRDGHGGSVRMRATATYVPEENAIYFTEIPYGVYVSTIVSQIVAGINDGSILGIAKDGIKDLSKMESNLKIVMEKNTNVNRLIKTLFKLTSLDSYYTVNMTMLDNGTRPKVFGWKEALQAHIDHEINVRTKIHNYHVNRIDRRINIIDGILLAIANIDDVVNLIRNSDDKKEAKEKLIAAYGFNEEQVDAILKMTLSKLIHLELESYKNEKDSLLLERESHINILSNIDLLYDEIEADFKRVADKFGDDRRTRLTNMEFVSDEEDAEPIEKKELIINYTNLGNIYTSESTTLVKTKRGGKGSKLKIGSNEVITNTITDTNYSSLLVFSNKGKMYSLSIDDLNIGSKVNVASLFDLEPGEKITTITSINRKQDIKYFTFVTKNGMIKKTKANEYLTGRNKAIKAINLKDGDEVVNVLFINDESIGILASSGCFVNVDTSNITAIGRASMGVKGINLKDGEYVLQANAINSNDKYILTLSKKGLVKKTSMEDFPLCNRGIKGKKISGVRANDEIIKFLTFSEKKDIIIVGNKKNIKISSDDISELARTATGVIGINLDDGEYATNLIIEEFK